MNVNLNQDTICAIATANGVGAIGIIRISGNEAFKIAAKIFEGKNLEEVKSHTIHYGYIVDKSQERRKPLRQKIRWKFLFTDHRILRRKFWKFW